MNKDNIKATIKILKDKENFRFDMLNKSTCIFGAAAIAGGFDPYGEESELGNFLELKCGQASEIVYPDLEDYSKIKRKHAVRLLKNLMKTGEVDWTCTKRK